MRCQPYFATKTAAVKRAIVPRLTITGSTVRRRVMRGTLWTDLLDCIVKRSGPR